DDIHVLSDQAGKPFPLAGRTKRSRLGSALVQLPEEQLEFMQIAGETMPARRDFRPQIADLQLRDDEVLDKRRIFSPPFTLVPYLRLADTNGDNQLSGREVRAFIELQRKLVTRSTILTIVDRGSSLFEFLDADHDRRLSRRELMTAWEGFAPWAKGDAVRVED